MSEPLNIGDKVWYIGNTGKQAQALPEDCTAEVVMLVDYNRCAQLNNGAVLDRHSLRGYAIVEAMEDFGAIRVSVNPERWQQRKELVHHKVSVRAFRSKEHWQQHVERTRAWATLLSRMQMHDQEDMEPFTVGDIQAAELALFGDIEP